MALPPPPADVFESREALIVSTQEWAAGHGYAVVVARSKAGKVYLQCDRGDTYRNRHQLTDDTRHRRTGSRLIACPFSIIGLSQHRA